MASDTVGLMRRPAPMKVFALSLLGVTFVVVVRNRILDARNFFDPWQTGDWLINYQGGFTRRGLIGEIIYRLGADGDALVDLVTAVHVGLLLVVFVAVGWLVILTDVTWTWIMLMFSPAWLLFPVLVPDAGLRKELFGLAIVAALAVAVRTGTVVITATVLVPAFAVAALSHEATVVMVPAILLLLWHDGPVSWSDRPRILLSGTYVLVAAIALVLAARYSGGEQVVGICESWRSRGLPCEGGALGAMTQSLRSSVGEVGDRYPLAFRFLPAAALAFLPIWLTGLPSYRPRACLAILGVTLPLFVFAMDYGRWVHIVAAQLSLIALAFAPALERRMIRVGPAWAVAYCTLWAMHHFDPRFTDPLAIRWLTSLHELVR